jgi:hypothetical protein
MAAPVAKKSSISPELQRVLDWHRAEAARLREKLGDPEEAMAAFVREHFDQEAAAQVAREMRNGASFWNDDDELWERYDR